MFRRIFASAVFAALAAGILASLLQALVTTPLIMQAESYEGAIAALGDTHQHDHGGHDDHDHEHGGWMPEQGLERTLFTSLSTIVIAFGWSLMLVALMALKDNAINGRKGLIWGFCGFLVAGLAPSFGLPPELPGMTAAELGSRQSWWILAIVATAAGLWCLAFAHAQILRVAGLVLIALPHLIGAPQVAHWSGSVPPELAAQFATTSLGISAIFWVVLGWAAGESLARFDQEDASA